MGVLQWLKGLFVGAGCLALGTGIVMYQHQMNGVRQDSSFHAGSAPAEPAEADPGLTLRGGVDTSAVDGAQPSADASEPADPAEDTPARNWVDPSRETEGWQARQSIDDHFVKVQALPVGERMRYWSDYLAKSGPDDLLRWTRDPASNAPKIEDSAPLIPERFDCTTYVETVAALARANSPEDIFDELLAIRYREGRGEYLSRNHFPEVDWIPNNERAGVLRDVTREVAGQSGIEAAVVRKAIDKAGWLAEQVRKGGVERSIASVAGVNDDEQHWRGTVEAAVPYIPKGELDKVIARIPDGAVLNLVRQDNPKHPVLVSHQGIIVREGSRVMLRHSTTRGRIRTVELKRYLEQSKRYRSWPVLGFNLNQINET